jgi:hypothetical protein
LRILGLVVNTSWTDSETAAKAVTPEDVTLQMAFVGQQRLDEYSQIVEHARRRKAIFE